MSVGLMGCKTNFCIEFYLCVGFMFGSIKNPNSLIAFQAIDSWMTNFLVEVSSDDGHSSTHTKCFV